MRSKLFFTIIALSINFLELSLEALLNRDPIIEGFLDFDLNVNSLGMFF
jgi:hypothetical protein